MNWDGMSVTCFCSPGESPRLYTIALLLQSLRMGCVDRYCQGVLLLIAQHYLLIR